MLDGAIPPEPAPPTRKDGCLDMAGCIGTGVAILGILGAILLLLFSRRSDLAWLAWIPESAILPVAALGTAVTIGLTVCLFRLGRRHARRRRSE